MQGLVLEDESVWSRRKWFLRKAILLSHALSLWHPPCLEDFSASASRSFGKTNKLRSSQTIFLSWMTCFHQNKILIGGELNLFFSGGIMVVRRDGVLGRTDTRTLIWFRLKIFLYLCSSFVRNCIIIQSQGACCSVKSFPGCCCKLIFCALAGCAFGAKEVGWVRLMQNMDWRLQRRNTATDQARPAYSLNLSIHSSGGNLEETICPEESQCFFTGWVNIFPNTEFEKLNPSNSSWNGKVGERFVTKILLVLPAGWFW